MTLRITASGIDTEALLADVRRVIEEKKSGAGTGAVLSEAEVRQIAEHRLHPVLHPEDVSARLLAELLAHPERWGYRFDAETVYRSSRGAVGQTLERLRAWLRPVQKLFWNPNPMISALSRQGDLNVSFVHLLHNLTVELTRQNLELQELKNRNLQLQGRLELLARRGKTLEGMAVLKDEPGP